MIKIPDMRALENGMISALGAQIADEIPGQIGNPVDQTVLVTGTDKQDLVWIHGLGPDPTSAYPAINNLPKESLVYGAPVLVRKTVNGYVITTKDFDRWGKFWQGADAHDQQPVYLSQLMYATLQPTVPSPSMKVMVIGGMFTQDDVSYRVPDQETADFSTSPDDVDSVSIDIPTTNTRALGVLVQVDVTTNTLSYKQGSEFDSNLTHTQAFDAGYYPDKDEKRFRVGYVRLVKGMTEINYNHLWQAPELLTNGGGGGDSDPLIFGGWA